MAKNRSWIIPFLFVASAACNDSASRDSEKVAEQSNEKKADSSSLMENIEDDSKFVVKATSGVSMEVELGRYAQKNAATAEVKLFGETMLKDHSKDKAELQKLAADKRITIPAEPGADFQKHIDEITSKKGADFDKEYINFMVSDHKDDISEFEKEAKDGKDADIKTFAAKGSTCIATSSSNGKSAERQVEISSDYTVNNFIYGG